jgi:hypothetical protein
MVQLGHNRLQVVVRLTDRRGAEGVGLHDVGAGRKIRSVDLLNHFRLGQAQQVIVALQVVREVSETRGAEIHLGQRVGLHHRAHGPVKHGNALGKELAEGGIRWRFDGRGRHGRGAVQARTMGGKSEDARNISLHVDMLICI